jgi:transposase InsO family protein
MELCEEFVLLAQQENSNMAQLCRRFDISRKTGYKWLERFKENGLQGLEEGRRRPIHSPRRVSEEIEQVILKVRQTHPAWGGRKIKAYLDNQGVPGLPSPSTITEILRRTGCLNEQEAVKHKAWKRFEHEAPNHLWQMDFKGHFAVGTQRCNPLTVLDDHSRFSLCLAACENQQTHTVKTHLTQIFQRYGLPLRMTMDNGSPWGSDDRHPYTPLTVWLLELGIGVSHSRPYHPQTQGKDERFHRTLKAELLQVNVFRDLIHCQHHFDSWRTMYNCERPHQALQMQVPASRYRPSEKAFPEHIIPFDYGPDDQIRRVQQKGIFSFSGKLYKISKAFTGKQIALRPTPQDGVMAVYFRHKQLCHINLKEAG